MLMFSNPLEKMRNLQPFGVNYLGKGAYKAAGLPNDLHNGWDLSTDGISGKPCFAVADGTVVVEGSPERGGYGLVARLYVPVSADMRLEVVYGHLQKAQAGFKKRGEQIGECDNSGFSTGPHLHFGVRIQLHDTLSGWTVKDYDNGYLGYVDPEQFFPKVVFDLPVDKGYGLKPAKSELAWYVDAAYIWKKTGKLPTFREKMALLYGRWDLRTVLDDAMWPVWSQYSKPEAMNRGIVK
jgi:murein DD-endopeptidase MepM/ murein hydrolase activator NlpD